LIGKNSPAALFSDISSDPASKKRGFCWLRSVTHAPREAQPATFAGG
jgi:hypothetical protein